MGFSRKINYFLVHQLGFTNKEAKVLISGQQVKVDGNVIRDNCLLDGFSEIRVNDRVVRGKKNRLYLKFHKPPGYESTLNERIENNLAPFFKEHDGLAIAGRLDKWSEGLLVLSNDGKWVEELCNPLSEKEKEYLVTLDRMPDAEFFEHFTCGVLIGNYRTKPCRCEPGAGNQLTVTLTEGKNRQIRRMCGALGYKVVTLKRTRMATICLDRLLPGEAELFSPGILQ